MSWDPDPTVTIGGTDYTGSTLETVRITRGRQDVYSEPRAGYLFAEVIDLDGTGIDVDILDTITVTLDDSTGSPQTVFSGEVSDWSAQLYDPGTETGTAKALVTIIAVGPLAELNRKNVLTGGRAQEADGDRIAALVKEGLARTWAETGGTWGTVGTATTTWATVDPGYDATYIDTPGVYQIAALAADAGGYNPLAEGYLTAQSGRGIIWDTPDGIVAYADAERRQTNANAGYLELPESVILAGTLSTASSFADIVNKVAVAFDGGRVIREDAESIAVYRPLAREFELNLANLSAAQDWGDDYLADHAAPSVNLGQVDVRLDGVSDDTLRDDLIVLDVNDAVRLEDLPGTLGPAALRTFVEGVEWRINRSTIRQRLFLSDYRLSIGAQRWNLVTPTLKWQDVNGSLQWQNVEVL